MAIIDVRTWSECLKRQISFKLILPNDVDGSNKILSISLKPFEASELLSYNDIFVCF